jgi:hypothetical protein
VTSAEHPATLFANRHRRIGTLVPALAMATIRSSTRIPGRVGEPFIVLALVLAACQSLPNVPATHALPSPAVATPTAAAGQPATPEEMEAMRLRGEWGFRADLDYVRALAANPEVITEPFGVPFTPDEFKAMQRKPVGRDAVLEAVEQESERGAADFCGRYTGPGQTVVSMWRANLHPHAINIAFDLGSFQYLAFDSNCRYSWSELTSLQERIGRDADLLTWMRTLPATWTGVGADTLGNYLSMTISSSVPHAAELVHQHLVATYGVPDGMVLVRSDGTGQALRPWGTVRIFTLRPNGKPVGPNDLFFDWQPLDPPNGECGVGDMGYGPGYGDGGAELPCQEGTWRIRVMGAAGDQDGAIELGAGTAVVRAGRTTDLTIRLRTDPAPQPTPGP